MATEVRSENDGPVIYLGKRKVCNMGVVIVTFVIKGSAQISDPHRLHSLIIFGDVGPIHNTSLHDGLFNLLVCEK